MKGPEFRRVSLANTPRRGVLGQASVLDVTSYPDRTSVVLRGKWILENLLNAPPPPPPADVPDLDEAAVGEHATLRQRMEVASRERGLRVVPQRRWTRWDSDSRISMRSAAGA